MSKGNHIDDYFKQHLDVEKDGFMEEDWAKMEQKLNAAGLIAPGSGFSFTYLQLTGLIAAIAIIAFMIGYQLSPQTDRISQDTSTVKTNVPIAMDSSAKEQPVESTWKKVEMAETDNQIRSNNQSENQSEKEVLFRPISKSQIAASSNHNSKEESSQSKKEDTAIDSAELMSVKYRTVPSILLMRPSIDKLYFDSISTSRTALFTEEKEQVEKMKPSLKRTQSSSLQWAISYGADFNGAALTGPKQHASLVGTRLQYVHNNRWLIGTGAFYNKKSYGVTGEAYTPPSGYWLSQTNGIIPEWIDASCGMVEIPLYIGWKAQLTNHLQAVVTSGVGLLYILDETYNYEFEQPNPGASKSWQSTYNTKEGIASATVSVGVNYRLKRKGTIQLETYIKPPLSKIGWGNVSLYGQGMMMSYLIPFQF